MMHEYDMTFYWNGSMHTERVAAMNIEDAYHQIYVRCEGARVIDLEMED